MCWRTDAGQATVEAAFLIPVLFVVLLMLIQPGIILYDRMVMNYAAAEGCRLLATSGASSGTDEARCQELIKRHLQAIPQQDLFHVHGGSCSYEVALSGNESSSQVSVRISNKLKLLPLFDFTASLTGAAQDGCIQITVQQSQRTQPPWVEQSPTGADPGTWVGSRG